MKCRRSRAQLKEHSPYEKRYGTEKRRSRGSDVPTGRNGHKFRIVGEESGRESRPVERDRQSAEADPQPRREDGRVGRLGPHLAALDQSEGETDGKKHESPTLNTESWRAGGSKNVTNEHVKHGKTECQYHRGAKSLEPLHNAFTISVAIPC